MSQTIDTTSNTFEIPPSESIKATTIILSSTLLLMTLKGLNVLNNLRILMNLILNYDRDISKIELITIKKSR